MDPHNVAPMRSAPQALPTLNPKWLGGAKLPAPPPPAAIPTNEFRRMWSLGFKRLVPVLPIDAVISDRSTMARRPEKALGKAPGVRGSDGKFFGFDWTKCEADGRDLDKWAHMGCGVGIKTGRQHDGTWLIAIDADTLNPDIATKIAAAARRHFGGAVPTRIGRAPKALYLVRLSGELTYSRDEFDDGSGEDARIEYLSEGRQFVASGIHPKTLRPYEWTVPLTPFDELPVIDVATLDKAFRSDATTGLPALKPTVREGAATRVEQAALRGDAALVRKAVAALPNTSALFPTRESYRDVGYAIKASLPDEPDLALDLFQKWCGRWTDGANDPAIVESDWRRMHPPFRRGASWIFEKADQHSEGKFDRAEQWFVPPADPPLFPLAIGETASPPEIAWMSPVDWEGRSPKPREWEVVNWIPRNEVTSLYGDGGVGKTLLAHQYAHGRRNFHFGREGDFKG